MATYIGFYTIDPNYTRSLGEKARRGDNGPDVSFQERVTELRDKLPGSLTLIGSYSTSASNQPNVWICETDDPRDLQFVSNYYTGYLVFDWVPATPLGATAEDTKAAMEAAAANR